MNTDIRFVLADNQDITRTGLKTYIKEMFSETEVLELKTKTDLVETLNKSNVGVVVLDYTLFDLNGVEEFLVLQKRHSDISWILFSNELSEDFIRRLSVEHNVSMILKENSAQEIQSALKCAAGGERFLCHQIANLLITVQSKPEIKSVLTPTETDILKMIAHGKTVKEIAAQRNLSIHTVITHKKNIFRKLEVNNVYEATKYALRAGLIEMVEYYI